MNENYDRTSYAAEKARSILKQAHAEKGIIKLLLLGQILAFAGILLASRSLARNLMYSRLQPDFAAYAAIFGAQILVFIMLGLVRRHLRKSGASSAGSVNVEPVEDSRAYISGEFLVLEKNTRNGNAQMVFELQRIHRLKSGGGMTSFTYKDPQTGFTEFSCEDIYEPRISTLLRARGIGMEQ